MSRPKCQSCFDHLAAINYHRGQQTYYRKLCDQCLRKGRSPRSPVPAWYRSGYKIKDRCEKCNFRSRVEGQISIWYVDQNEQNVQWNNLKSVCANCKIELKSKFFAWDDLRPRPDF